MVRPNGLDASLEGHHHQRAAGAPATVSAPVPGGASEEPAVVAAVAAATATATATTTATAGRAAANLLAMDGARWAAEREAAVGFLSHLMSLGERMPGPQGSDRR